jgi:dTDP-4-dehydrorhamnose reductase
MESNVLRAQKGLPALLAKQIQPITTAQYPTPAKRPANSLLDTTKLSEGFNIAMPDWRDSLKQVLKDLKA